MDRAALIPHSHPSPMRIAHLRQHLRDLGAKPRHLDHLLHEWCNLK
jgi:hypothetical protein